MGFADQARRILEYNRGLLREKEFFSKLGKPYLKNSPTQVDSKKFKENALRKVENQKIRILQRRIVIFILIFIGAVIASVSILLF